jgi:hypothetical protein
MAGRRSDRNHQSRDSKAGRRRRVIGLRSGAASAATAGPAEAMAWAELPVAAAPVLLTAAPLPPAARAIPAAPGATARSAANAARTMVDGPSPGPVDRG